VGVSNDILADFKNHRFVVLDASTYQPWAFGEFAVVLTDIRFWNTHYTDLEKWCKLHGADIYGMTVSFCDEPSFVLFNLRWA
jgi:hypothetical protein